MLGSLKNCGDTNQKKKKRKNEKKIHNRKSNNNEILIIMRKCDNSNPGTPTFSVKY